MIAAGVVLCIVVGYLVQPVATRGARWLWRRVRILAGVGLEVAWQVAETIGAWSVEAVEMLNPWRRRAEVERKLAEVRCDLDEARLDFTLARIEVRAHQKLLDHIRDNEEVQKVLLDEANRKVELYQRVMYDLRRVS